MRRVTLVSLCTVLSITVIGMSPTTFRAASSPPVATREIIAVYFGTVGTDAQSGMTRVVPEMKTALAKQAAASGRHFLSRGVSLEPSVDRGLRHLALLGPFDEVSVGGNWTNSTVVRYLGPTMDDTRTAGIPQVVLLEREVRQNDSTVQVGAERELGRYVGVGEIDAWVRRGAPLPR